MKIKNHKSNSLQNMVISRSVSKEKAQILLITASILNLDFQVLSSFFIRIDILQLTYLCWWNFHYGINHQMFIVGMAFIILQENVRLDGSPKINRAIATLSWHIFHSNWLLLYLSLLKIGEFMMINWKHVDNEWILYFSGQRRKFSDMHKF